MIILAYYGAVVYKIRISINILSAKVSEFVFTSHSNGFTDLDEPLHRDSLRYGNYTCNSFYPNYHVIRSFASETASRSLQVEILEKYFQ